MSRTTQLPPHAEITERDFQRQVVDIARMLGFRVYHPWLSVHSERGFPDLTLIKPPRLVFAELKSDRGRPTSAQETWLDLLKKCGVEAHLWRPKDLASGAILAVLTGRETARWVD